MYFIEQVKYIAKNKNEKKEIKKVIIGFCIAILGLMILIFTLVGSTSTNEGVSISTTLKKNITNILLEKIFINFLGDIINNLFFFITFYIILLLIYAYQIYKSPKTSAVGIVAVIWQFLIYLFIYSDFATHKTNTIFLILIFIFWISLDEKELKINNKKSIIFEFIIIFFCTFILLISDINGLQYIKKEITEKYSDSVGVAKYINNNLESDAIFVCTNVPRASAIIPYLKNATFINPINMKEFTYVTWDETAYKIVGVNKIIENMKKSEYNGKNIYLIESIFSIEDNEMIKKFQNQNVLSETLYKSDIKNVYGDESYKIYKINL